MKIFLKCKNEVLAGFTYCPDCGTELKITWKYTCPKCGKSTDFPAKFCTGCGRKIK